MQTMIRLISATSLIGILLLQGCAYENSSADVYSSRQAQREQTVRMGTIESVRLVKIRANMNQAGAGALGGGLAGGIVGSTFGGGRGALLTTLGGAAAGAYAGHNVEGRVRNRNGVEITVRLDSGNLRAITQEATKEVFKAGDRVRLLSSGGITRVTH